MMNFLLPDNPYTEESFRQNMRNRTAELQQAVLSARQAPVSEPVGNAVPTGGYEKYGTFGSFTDHLNAALSRSGVSPAWASGITELVKRESGFNPKAKNPTSTAYGYGQFLASTRSNYEKKTGLSYDNPVNQLIMMMQYVKDRYGTPDNALNFWNKNKWY